VGAALSVGAKTDSAVLREIEEAQEILFGVLGFIGAGE